MKKDMLVENRILIIVKKNLIIKKVDSKFVCFFVDRNNKIINK
jgi:hypothetical protein